MYVMVFILCFFVTFFINKLVVTKVRGFIGARYIRILIANLSFLIIFIFFEFPDCKSNLTLIYFLISILLGLVIIVLDSKKLFIMFNGSYIKMLPRLSFGQLITSISMVFITPIFEELAFRGVLSSVHSNVILIIITVILFNLIHYLNGNKQIILHIQLLLLSVLTTSIYFYTDNIVYPIIIHITFNLPLFVFSMKQYINKG